MGVGLIVEVGSINLCASVSDLGDRYRDWDSLCALGEPVGMETSGSYFDTKRYITKESRFRNQKGSLS